MLSPLNVVRCLLNQTLIYVGTINRREIALSTLGLEFGIRIRQAVPNIKQLETPQKKEEEKETRAIFVISPDPFFFLLSTRPRSPIALSPLSTPPSSLKASKIHQIFAPSNSESCRFHLPNLSRALCCKI